MQRHAIEEHAPLFVTGASGYLGRHLIPCLIARGHQVTALARPAAARHVPQGCRVIVGDALQTASYAEQVPPGATFIHLVGVAHPSPAKHAEFRSIDLASLRCALEAAQHAASQHFIYVSVAHPAPVMHSFIAARREGEALLRGSGLPATILRPWYVLGPGHRWPYLLLPAYWLLECLPATRDTARRLRPVRLRQMVSALCDAVEHPARGVRIMDAAAIAGFD